MRNVAAFDAELRAAGAWVFSGGLHDAATRHRGPARDDQDFLTIDGPYAEGKEHVGGIVVITRRRPGRRAGLGPQGQRRRPPCRSRCGRSSEPP